MAEVKISVTFRHTHPSDALRKYVADKLRKIGKYFPRPLEAHVVLSVDSRDRQLAEVTLQARRLTLHGREETTDLYSAIDLVLDKVEQQIRKYKSRVRLRRRRGRG